MAFKTIDDHFTKFLKETSSTETLKRWEASIERKKISNFLNKDGHQQEEKDEYGFSESTKDWLRSWFSGSFEIKDVPESVVLECSKYRPNRDEHITIYKSFTERDVVTESGFFVSEKPTNWKHLTVTSYYKPDSMGPIGILVSKSDILIDTNELDADYISSIGGFPDRRVVILLPGSYQLIEID